MTPFTAANFFRPPVGRCFASLQNAIQSGNLKACRFLAENHSTTAPHLELTDIPPTLSPSAVRPRGLNALCRPAIADKVLASARHYHFAGRWYARLVLLMPDHLHALLSFPSSESITTVIRSWKHYVAGHHGVVWQRDFFDHRVRSGESLEEKACYIRLNPVRAGLITCPDDWPYFWESPA